jgi:hypothetical protein
VWIDLDGNGLSDLVVDNSGFPPKSRLVVFKQNKDHSFEDMANTWGLDILNPHGTIVMDFNQDGKMDIITAQVNSRNAKIKQRIWAFQNNIDFKENRGIRLFLQGDKSNIRGYNSLVQIYIKKGEELKIRKYYIETIRGAIASQNEDGLFFALAADETIQKIIVQWPILKEAQKIYEIKDRLLHNTKIVLYEKGGHEIR